MPRLLSRHPQPSPLVRQKEPGGHGRPGLAQCRDDCPARRSAGNGGRGTVTIVKHYLAGLLAAVVAAAAPGSVVAEEGSGSVTYLSIWAETFDLPSGAKVHRNYNKGVVLADDSAIPFNLATQDCRGSRVIGADGAVTFDSGFCDTIDVECDMWTLWYRNDAAGRS